MQDHTEEMKNGKVQTFRQQWQDQAKTYTERDIDTMIMLRFGQMVN